MGSLWLPQSGSLRCSCAIAAFLSCALTASVQAQDIEVTPAHVSVVDGRASLLRDGQLEQLGTGMPFVPGDQLRTEAGRAEILFPDGSALDVDEFTSVDLMSPTLMRVTAGRVLLVVFGAANPSAAVRYQIDTPSASAATDGPGEYRVAIFDGAQTELAVTRGWAALSTEAGTTPVRAGERTIAAAGRPPSGPQLFNSARFDAFDRWVAAQRGDRAGLAASSQYLPNDLRAYSGDFDRSGNWGYDASYGNVWYPTVQVGWRPYYNGYWSSVPSYGWTWIGFDRWAWPTHHYGRWGYHANRWFWVPGRHWSPAWVSWGVAPGYVSWCPLGFNNQPVFALSVSFGNVWAGWTVVPRAHFARAHVGQWAVTPDRLGGAPFARSATPPVPVPRTRSAVPRQVVTNGSQGGAAAPPAFVSRQAPPRAQIRPRNPQSAAETSTAGQVSGAVRSPFPIRNPQPAAAPSSPGREAGGGWVIPRQPGAVAAPSPVGDSTMAARRQPLDSAQRQVGTAPIVPPEARGGTNGRVRNPYLPSVENPYARPNERGGSPRLNQPGVNVPPSTSRETQIERPAPRPESAPRSDAGGMPPRWNGRDNSNSGSQQGSAVPRNESGGGRQNGNSNAQPSNSGGAQSNSGRQAQSGGGGARQRRP